MHHTFPKLKLSKIYPFKTTTPPQSENYWKSALSGLPHPAKVEIVNNQFFQVCHILSKWKFSEIILFKTTTLSQNENCPKPVLSRPPHTLKVEIVDYHSVQAHHIIPKWKSSKISPLNNQALPKWKLSKTSHYKTTTSSQGRSLINVITFAYIINVSLM